MTHEPIEGYAHIGYGYVRDACLFSHRELAKLAEAFRKVCDIRIDEDVLLYGKIMQKFGSGGEV